MVNASLCTRGRKATYIGVEDTLQHLFEVWTFDLLRFVDGRGGCGGDTDNYVGGGDVDGGWEAGGGS
jgi:hypothetical protein